MVEKNDGFGSCDGKIKIFPDGSFHFKPDNVKKCKSVLDKMNPTSGKYWKRHIEELRHEVKHLDID